MSKWLPIVAKFLVGFILVVVLFYAGMQWYVHDTVEKGIHEAVDKVDELELNYSRLDVDISDHVVTLTEVDIKRGRERFFADKLVISNFDQKHEPPHSMSIRADGMVLPVDVTHLGPLASLFKELGMVELRGDGTLDYAFDPDNNTLNIQNLRFTSDTLGDFAMEAAFGNINLDDFRQEQLVGLHIVGADISFRDSGLMDRILDAYAAHSAMSRQEAREFLATEVAALALGAKAIDNKHAEQAFLGLGSFVNDPQEIIIRATPEEPVPWLYFFMGRDVFESIRLLDLVVENLPAEQSDES